MTQADIHERAYTTLIAGAALQMRPAHGVLVLTGEDRVDFVQRMTTNNVAVLAPGQSAVTVLTSPVARILYVFTVMAQAEALWLLPAGEDVAQLSRHLRGQIFFMDKVKVEDRSDAVRRMRLMGPGAAALLQGAGLPAPEAESFAESDGIYILHQTVFDLPGYELVVPAASADDVGRRLMAAGAVALTGDAYTSRRVELGRPAVGSELTEEYSPLEAGLAWACADNKGCYTGQEIIARQITYDKVTRTLAGLRSDGAVSAGAEVMFEGRSIGRITSAAYSPALDAPIALAILRRPHNAVGAVVEVEGRQATVTSLPFV